MHGMAGSEPASRLPGVAEAVRQASRSPVTPVPGEYGNRAGPVEQRPCTPKNLTLVGGKD